MDWAVTKKRALDAASAGMSAVADLAATYVPRLARHAGVLSVFFDGKVISVAVIRPRNSHSRVEKSAVITLDEDAFENPEAAGRAIAAVTEGMKKPPRALVAAIGAELTFERRITLPPMPPAETDAAVDFQADRVLPFPAGEMGVDYTIESVASDGTQSIVIAATTNETLEKISAVALAAGRSLAAVYAAPAALYGLVVAADEPAAGAVTSVIYRRTEGVEIAVGATHAPSLSRFARNGAASSIAAELARTASAAGVRLDGPARVFAPREIADLLSDSGLGVYPLDRALEAGAEARPEDASAAVAVAAGTLYVRGMPLPNFHTPSALARRNQRSSALHSRIAKYAAAAAGVVAFLVLYFAGYWIYTLALESRAQRFALANADLKAAVARAETARPWTNSRSALLDVLANASEVFPDSSQAFVKSLSIAESGKVSIQGKVGTPQAAYDLVAALSTAKGFQNVKLDSGAADSAGGYSFAISFETDNWRVAR